MNEMTADQAVTAMAVYIPEDTAIDMVNTAMRPGIDVPVVTCSPAGGEVSVRHTSRDGWTVILPGAAHVSTA
jgi:hypothetical protein